MDNSLKAPDSENVSDKSKKANSLSNKEIVGKIGSHIGTGKNAKDSFIWMTITWSFTIASGLSLLFFIRSFFTETSGLIDSIKDVWTVFIPVITLALGYAFGKGE
jgi:hypothetical protein